MIEDATIDERTSLVVHARTWLGTPFKFRGVTRKGVDCVTLLMLLGREVLGWNVPNPAYSKIDDGKAWRWIRHHCRRIPAEDACPGDIVQFAYGGEAVHFGLLTDLGFIHAAVTGKRGVREDRMSDKMAAKAVAFHRPAKGMAPWRS